MRKAIPIIVTAILAVLTLFTANYFFDFAYKLPYKNPRPPIITSAIGSNPVISSEYARQLLLDGKEIPDNYGIAIDGLVFQLSPDGDYITPMPYRVSKEELYFKIMNPNWEFRRVN